MSIEMLCVRSTALRKEAERLSEWNGCLAPAKSDQARMAEPQKQL